MPKKIHDKLIKEYLAKGLKGKELDNAVYGTLAKIEKQRKRKKKR